MAPADGSKYHFKGESRMNESRKAVNLRPKVDKVEWKQQTIRIPADVHKALKVKAAQEGKPVAQVIEALVRAWLQQGART